MDFLNYLDPIPRLSLGQFPTPLHPMARLERQWGHPGVFIKRDDLNGLGPGGNKVRSLEFLLAEAVERGCDTIFAAGPLQSNLCALTAAACAKLGLDCVLVLSGDQPSRLEGNLLLNQLLGAQVHYVGQVDQQARAAQLGALCDQSRQLGHTPYVIENGATTGRGALGYVAAVGELVAQWSQHSQQRLTIYVPAGNGGVAAGLVLGNYLAGNPFDIVVVSVEYPLEETCTYVHATLLDSAAILGVSVHQPLSQLCRVTAQFRGDGWGCNTLESEQAVLTLARQEGILSENVYTSKVLVAMEQEVRRGDVYGPVCFLHTGGIGSLYAQYG